MGLLAALRIKLLIVWMNILRLCLPYASANKMAARTIRYFHPAAGKQKPRFTAGLKHHLECDDTIEQAWNRHLALLGVQRFQSTFYAGTDTSWIERCQVDIQGADIIDRLQQQGKGVLVMTYHHHFNMLFCNLLGRLGLPIATIAMDDRGSDRYQKFSKRVNRIYDHAERLLNGGEIILVKPQSQVRPILRAFEKNQLVVTANDFPDTFDDKNRRDFSFLGTTLSCPTGTVKLAVKKQIPIVAAYLNWNGNERFRLSIHPVSNGEEAMTPESAMENYLGVLETLVNDDPGLWEGWKWLP